MWSRLSRVSRKRSSNSVAGTPAISAPRAGANASLRTPDPSRVSRRDRADRDEEHIGPDHSTEQVGAPAWA